MRLGSLEVLGALALFGIAVSRFTPMRPRAKPATSARIALRVFEPPARGGIRDVDLALSEKGLPAIIGRSSDAAVGLLDPETSRNHAAMRLVKGGVYLSDLGSMNATFLNGKRVDGGGIEVFPGDVIDTGSTRIEIVTIEGDAE